VANRKLECPVGAVEARVLSEWHRAEAERFLGNQALGNRALGNQPLGLQAIGEDPTLKNAIWKTGSNEALMMEFGT
jgi:hypothetical protein